MKSTILVLTNHTAVSDDLFAALRERAKQGPTRFEFVMPPDRPGLEARREAQERLEQALERARTSGLDVEGRVGDPDALECATEAYDPARHDEILVSTLPASTSHWLQIDLPARVARATNALVSHVTAREPHAAPRS